MFNLIAENSEDGFVVFNDVDKRAAELAIEKQCNVIINEIVKDEHGVHTEVYIDTIIYLFEE